MSKMNGLRLNLLHVVLFGMTALIAACASEPATESDDSEEVIEIGGEQEVIVEDQVHYTLPAPNEMMEIIRESGSDFKKELLCQPDVADKYVDLKGKSIGMGIYIADLAYSVSFNRFQESMQEFNNIVKLANELGIGSVFNEDLTNRIKNNLDHEDSLMVISDHSYYKIIGNLEEEQRGHIVGMIAAGGFLETMFIATQVVDKFDKDDHLMQRIAGQKLVYENIMNYLEQYKDDQAVEWTITDMQALKEIFDQISSNRRDTKFEEGAGGKRVLGGKGGVYITEQEFEELRYQVAFLRNAITFNSDVPQ